QGPAGSRCRKCIEFGSFCRWNRVLNLQGILLGEKDCRTKMSSPCGAFQPRRGLPRETAGSPSLRLAPLFQRLVPSWPGQPTAQLARDGLSAP
ncbi:unnamed protein product, partial [Gulo gulo]